jgi:hypothetical protein
LLSEISHPPPTDYDSTYGRYLLLFMCWTWVTGAVKDEGTTESCSIATLMKIISAFYKLLFHREHLVRKSMPSIMCQGYISTGKHSLKINSLLCLFLNGNREAGKAR